MITGKIILGTFMACLIFILSMFKPVGNLLVSCMLLSLSDTIWGIWVAWRIDKVPITAAKFFVKLKTISILGILITATIFADPALQAVGLQSMWGTEVLCGWYCVYELFSILEHAASVGFTPARKALEFLNQRFSLNSK